MTTQKNLVTMMLTSILTAGIFSFTSCSDDYEESLQNPNAIGDQQKITGDGDILAGSRAATMPFRIDANGAWTVERDCRFFNVVPSSGVGAMDVKIYFQNNDGEARRMGHLTIKSEGKDATLTIVQKTKNEDVATRADDISTSNCVYAVGYGYNTMERWAHPSSVKCEIFDTHLLLEEGKECLNTVDMDLNVTSVTGSSMNELTDNLSAKAQVKGGFGKFKAEASTNFDMNYAKKNTYEYALNYLDMTLRTARFDYSLDVLKNQYMTQSAYDAINGLSTTYQGAEGLKRLVEDYGTHVAVKANLGGRICYSMALDVTNIEGSYDLKSFAKASYDGIVDCSGEVTNEMKSSYKQNASKCETRLSVQGGDEKLAKILAGKDGFNKENVENWKESVTNHNLSLMGFGNGALVPLYELVDDQYPERRNELMTYFDGKNGQICSDFDCMVQSTITKVSLPQFNANGTLVKDILLGGQKVGIICNEYVPQINMEKRVNVVYPVINGKPRLNLGYFLGDSDHKPGRCSWDGISVTYEAAEEMPYGETQTLYLSGASVSAQLAYGDISRDGKVCDAWMTGQYFKDNKNSTHNYPLVKIANNIWTRQDYSGCSEGEYYREDALDGIKIEGWKIPMAQDFNAIKDMLAKYDSPLPALKMYDNKNQNAEDLTGFNLEFHGFKSLHGQYYNGIASWIWAQGENSKALIIFNKTGQMLSSENGNEVRGALTPGVQYTVRLVKAM